jgi:LmbE family N-acetylglucosaminyl deacetylase
MAYWIYMSPHFDDAAFSCGGLIWQQSQAGARVEVWTICAGPPPPGRLSPFAESLHQRWESRVDAVKLRQQEDITSNHILNAGYRHFPVPDCIYRKSSAGEYIYSAEESLFQGVDPREEGLIKELAMSFSELIDKETGEFHIVSPLGLGNHVDHLLVRNAVEVLAEASNNLQLYYYADFPYSLLEKQFRERQDVQEMQENCFSVSEEALDVWFRASAAHASQISTFWKDKNDLKQVLKDYAVENRGICLWKSGKFEKNRL